MAKFLLVDFRLFIPKINPTKAIKAVIERILPVSIPTGAIGFIPIANNNATTTPGDM